MASSGIQGWFFGLDAATLTSMQSEYIACIRAVATAGQSYSISGRAFTRANLPELNQTLAEITAALNRANGSTLNQTYPKFGNSYSGT